MRPDTALQHLGEERKVLGAVVPPIFQNSLFVFESVEHFTAQSEHDPGAPYYYSRIQNPTVEIPEKKIAFLEKAESGRLFSSGMAAVTAAVMNSARQGSHVVYVDTCYGPTQKLLAQYLSKWGIETTAVTGAHTQEVLDAIRPDTGVVYLESPSSILFRMQDFETISQHCRAKGITTITDNSYSGAVFQQPHAMGVDLVLHSATKYLAGHSDVVCGVVVGTGERMRSIAENELELFGSVLHPFPSWLVLRGLRTLKLRMKHAQETGNVVARWLKEQPWVERVFHVGLDDFEDRALRDKQMTGSSSLLTFEPKAGTEAWAKAFVNALTVYQRGVSWGGFESLAVALTMQPGDWPEPRWLIRLYNGLEDTADLLEDLKQAAEKVKELS